LDQAGFAADEKSVDAVGRNLEIIWQIIRSDLAALKRELPPGES
jgi:uncharacterized protein with HEPN domain